MGRRVSKFLASGIQEINREKEREKKQSRIEKEKERFDKDGPLYLIEVEDGEFIQITEQGLGTTRTCLTVEWDDLCGWKTFFNTEDINKLFPEYWGKAKLYNGKIHLN